MAQQLALQERRQVGVDPPGEVVEGLAELRVHPQDGLARHAAAVVPVVALSRAPELSTPGQLDQRRLQAVVVARGERLAHAHVVADAAREPGVGVEAIGRARARAQQIPESVHTLDQLVDGGLPAERLPAPRRRESPASRRASSRRAGAAPRGRRRRGRRRRRSPRRSPSRGRSSSPSIQRVEGAAVQGFRFRLGENLKARVDQRLHRALVEQLVAEPVDRAHARLFQMGHRFFEACPPCGARGGLLACPLQLHAHAQLQLAGRLLGEGHGDHALDIAAAFGEHRDQPRHQLAGLAGARRRLDDHALVERSPDAVARVLVDQPCHGQLRRSDRSSSARGSFSPIRRSSLGPQIGR